MNHHLKFAIREMRKNRLIVFGSLTSLVVGIFSVMLIYVWVQNELSTDQMHTKLDRIYMTMVQQGPTDVPRQIDAGLFFNVDYNEYPQIVSSTNSALFTANEIKLTWEETEWNGRGLAVDSTFLKIFDFELTDGTRDVLKSASNIVLSESMAEKMFGTQDAIGETVFLDCGVQIYLTVGAIMKDVPSNSSLHFDFLFPSHARDYWGKASGDFLLVGEDFDEQAFEEEIASLARKHQQFKESTLSVAPFSEHYFGAESDSELYQKSGDINEVYTLIAVALVVLLVSVFNFTNLQTTLVFSQMKNRSIKQIHGASKRDFWREVLFSRLIYGVLNMVLVSLLFELVKPAYLTFLEVSKNFTTLEMTGFVTIITGGFLLLSLAFSAVQSTSLFTGQGLSNQLLKAKSNRSGKTLTTIQYVLATVLIILTVVVYKQFTFMQNKDLGYSPENVVAIRFFEEVPYNFDNPEESRALAMQQMKDHERLKGELKNIPGVLASAQGRLPIDGSTSQMSWKLAQSGDEYSTVSFMALQPGYDEVLGLEIVKGRFFKEELDKDQSKRVLINRAAMEYWGIEDINGVNLANSSWGSDEKPFTIVGVIEDFHYQHLSKKVQPLVICYFDYVDIDFLLNVKEDRFAETMAQLEQLFNEVNDKRTFEYRLLENELAVQYAREKKLSDLFFLFTITGLLISSLGLFTFALFETRKRIKEIGIRKVVGANTGQIVNLLSISMIKWVLLAFLIACPLSWYLSTSWLANFANQTSLNWWMFAGAGMVVIGFAIVTVIGQTYMAARRNPVEALRYE